MTSERLAEIRRLLLCSGGADPECRFCCAAEELIAALQKAEQQRDDAQHALACRPNISHEHKARV